MIRELGIARPERTGGVPPSILLTEKLQRLVLAALPLIIAVDVIQASGEAKRHQVYSRLLKAFPGESKDEVAFALEVAIRKAKAKLWL